MSSILASSVIVLYLSGCPGVNSRIVEGRVGQLNQFKDHPHSHHTEESGLKDHVRDSNLDISVPYKLAKI